METQQATLAATPGWRRRRLLQAGLAAGVLAAWPLSRPAVLWGAEAEQPRRGGILRVRGWDPPHFDPHSTINQEIPQSLLRGYLVKGRA